MTRKRKGQLTMSGEWARHLRPLLRRAFWKAERQAEKRFIRGEGGTISSAAGRANGTVEELLATISALPREAIELDLWVPQALTLQGEAVSMDVAMTIVLDKALKRGLYPAGFTQSSGGRLYRYRFE